MTNLKGEYTVADIGDGVWLGRVEMRGFVLLEREVRVAANQEASVWSLEMLPLAAIVGKPVSLVVAAPACCGGSGQRRYDGCAVSHGC